MNADPAMHETIIEHVHHDRGKRESSDDRYDDGFKAGNKRAWDLVGAAADWYKSQINIREQSVGCEDDMSMRARYEAALWIQRAIKKDCL